jgi:hypothetical protein
VKNLPGRPAWADAEVEVELVGYVLEPVPGSGVAAGEERPGVVFDDVRHRLLGVESVGTAGVDRQFTDLVLVAGFDSYLRVLVGDAHVAVVLRRVGKFRARTGRPRDRRPAARAGADACGRCARE